MALPTLNTHSSAPAAVLTAAQQAVLDHLCTGQTVTAAAQATGLHRTTIHHWRRTNAQFALALQEAQTERAAQHQQALEARTTTALAALDRLLTDDRTPASIRFKAIQLVLNASLNPHHQTSLQQAEAEDQLRLRDLRHHHRALELYRAAKGLEQDLAGFFPLDQQEEILNPANDIHHNSSSLPDSPPVEPPAPARPKPTRNGPCPCASGRKYKQCCLKHPQPASREVTQ